MAQAAKTQEPSMEEILASIRRIIAEDDADKSVQRPAEPARFEQAADTPASSVGDARDDGETHSAPSGVAPPHEPRLSPTDAPAGAPRASRSSTILDLTQSMVSPAAHPTEPASGSSRVLEASSRPDPFEAHDARFDGAGAPESPAGVAQSAALRGEQPGGLISSATSAAVDSAFNALAETVLVQNARTLEDLVREMLRPMLKVWLDDNLPGLVERLVRAEIERVSRGRAD
jgi:cell pole-organizing protein PopZ